MIVGLIRVQLPLMAQKTWFYLAYHCQASSFSQDIIVAKVSIVVASKAMILMIFLLVLSREWMGMGEWDDYY